MQSEGFEVLGSGVIECLIEMSKRDHRTAGVERHRTSERETGKKKEETQTGEPSEQTIAQRITGNGNDKVTIRRTKRKEQ
ncbi:uncharacterized [Tachysurus ichikawai]